MHNKPKKGLLPETYADFRSVEFWDGFFQTRGGKPFEWYGDWKQLQAFIRAECETDATILVPGCGNSELSADMYDAGFKKITNLDFSKLLIMSMLKKNLQQRPLMKWQVGDMTKMKYPDGSFDAVIDKGGLDALMGDDAEASSKAGSLFLQEVKRVLTLSGVYLCTSLLQKHVLRLLLKELATDYKIQLNAVPPSPDMAQAALQPFFVAAKRRRVEDGSAEPSISSNIQPLPKAPNAEQLKEICQVLDEHKQRAERNGTAKGKSTATEQPEASSNVQDDFERLYPGRRALVDLTPVDESQLKAKQKSDAESQTSRFTAAVLDAEKASEKTALQECCVFLVPQGRESEWLFASEQGQWQVADQCKCKRLILVSLGRGHTFGTSAKVQKELSPLIKGLAQKPVRDTPKGIPIMTCQDGVGRRKVLCTEHSPLSGQIVVEDVELQDGAEEVMTVRRLVFVSNSSLIQSEASLIKSKGKDIIDHSQLCMEYHKHILAGLILGNCITKRQESATATAPAGLLIGLGGGGLAVFLKQFLHVRLLAVELDPAIISIAEQYFGLKPDARLEVHAGDGLKEVENLKVSQASDRKLDFIIVDAGSNDASLAMSCPPPPFLQPEFLTSALSVLRDSGLLVINCVTRSEKVFLAAIASVKEVFQELSCTSVDGDVNRVIFASQKNSIKQQGTEHQRKAAFELVLQSYKSTGLTQSSVLGLCADLADIDLS